MKAMMLSAGLGTRMAPYTLACPKPAIPFLNIPLAAYGLEILNPLQITELVVNTFHLSEKVEHLFKTQLAPWIPSLNISHETDFIRGSGGGLKLAERFFRDTEDLILMNSDEVFFPEDPTFFSKALEFHRTHQALATLVTVQHPEVGTKFGGVWTSADNQVLGFGKNKIPNSQGHHFIGIQILSKRIFKYLTAEKECNILYDGLQVALRNQESCWVYPTQGIWFETGNPADFLTATRESLNLLTSDQLPTSHYLRRLIKKYSSGSRLIRTPQAIVLAHETARWKPTQIQDFAVLGMKSQIGDECEIRSSVIGPYAQVNEDLKFSIQLA